MFRKIIVSISGLVIILFVILFIKESVASTPERILNNLIEKGNSKLQEKLEPPDTTFREGEELIFATKYMWVIPTGNANIEVKGPLTYQGRKIYHLFGKAETSPFFSRFFKASASIESYMDAEKLHSLRYKEETYIPEHEPEIKDITYDQKNLVMELDGVKRKILPNSQDPLSALFYIRAQEFEPGKTFIVNTIAKKKNYELKAEVLRKEVVKTLAGELEVWVLDSTIRRSDRSSYVHRGSFTAWLAGETKLPILIKARTRVGPITFRLVGLR